MLAMVVWCSITGTMVATKPTDLEAAAKIAAPWYIHASSDYKIYGVITKDDPLWNDALKAANYKLVFCPSSPSSLRGFEGSIDSKQR
jgi:hypothetical protein